MSSRRKYGSFCTSITKICTYYRTNNSIIWLPYFKQDIDRIEQVQRRFSKRLRGLSNYIYETGWSFWICHLWN